MIRIKFTYNEFVCREMLVGIKMVSRVFHLKDKLTICKLVIKFNNICLNDICYNSKVVDRSGIGL